MIPKPLAKSVNQTAGNICDRILQIAQLALKKHQKMHKNKAYIKGGFLGVF